MRGGFTIGTARAEHAAFIATATLLAERANLGKGMWDTFFDIGGLSTEAQALTCLEALVGAVERFPYNHLAYTNFFLAYDAAGLPVGSCSCYAEPTGIPKTWKALKVLSQEVLGWTKEQFQTGFMRLACMREDGAWPDLDIYNKTIWLETVYTAPSARRQGVSRALLRHCMEHGCSLLDGSPARVNILCAIGNDPALYLYKSMGLLHVGQFTHADALSCFNSPGFDVLSLGYPGYISSSSMSTGTGTGTSTSADSSSGDTVKVLVLTGGPCGGKTSLLSVLRKQLPEMAGARPAANGDGDGDGGGGGLDVYVVPEVPTMLMEGGAVYPGNDAGQLLLDFEVSMMRLQLAMEKAFVDIARSTGRMAVVVCDRAAVDIKAYVPHQLWVQVLEVVGETDESLLNRYDTVCHMVTAADGAEAFYNNATNVVRNETAAEALALDALSRKAWAAHPRVTVVDNSSSSSSSSSDGAGGGFDEKLQRAVETVGAQLFRVL